jgi:hypothetical protein
MSSQLLKINGVFIKMGLILNRVSTSYNFTRVLNILGIDKLRDYCVQRSENRVKNVQYA